MHFLLKVMGWSAFAWNNTNWEAAKKKTHSKHHTLCRKWKKSAKKIFLFSFWWTMHEDDISNLIENMRYFLRNHVLWPEKKPWFSKHVSLQPWQQARPEGKGISVWIFGGPKCCGRGGARVKKWSILFLMGFVIIFCSYFLFMDFTGTGVL